MNIGWGAKKLLIRLRCIFLAVLLLAASLPVKAAAQTALEEAGFQEPGWEVRASLEATEESVIGHQKPQQTIRAGIT